MHVAKARLGLQQKILKFSCSAKAKDFDFDEFLASIDPDPADVDFDALTLDKEFYQSIGEDEEQLRRHPPWAPQTTDPKGYNVGFEQYISERTDIPDYVKQDLIDAQYFGPPLLIVAGFRLEELPVLRTMIDKLIGKHVKLIPISGRNVLDMKVQDVIHLPEPDWSQPRPSHWTRTGTWGSQRTIVFGGLTMESQGTLVEVMEEAGLPPVCLAIVSERTREKKLGELLADAIKLQRDRKNPDKQLWDIDDRVVNDVTDLSGYYSNKIEERIDLVQEGLNSGKAKLVRDPATGILKVDMEDMDERIFDPEEISRPIEEATSSKSTTPSAKKSPTKPRKPANRKATKTTAESKSTKAKSKEKTVKKKMRAEPVTAKSGVSKPDPKPNDISEFFAIDDLVCDELGLEKTHRPDQLSSTPVPFSEEELRKPDPDAPKVKLPETGNVYPISTEPVTVEKDVKRSTVFTGVVPDAAAFMESNFGYDIEKNGGFTDDGPNTDKTHVDHESTSNDETDPKKKTSMEELVKAAKEKGVDLDKLKEMIDAMPERNERRPRPSFRRQQFKRKQKGTVVNQSSSES